MGLVGVAIRDLFGLFLSFSQSDSVASGPANPSEDSSG